MENYSFLMSVYHNDIPSQVSLSIDSMINQTLKPSEIVIVIDGPIEFALKELLDFYSKKYPNLIITHYLEKNSGLGNALNIGLKQCKNNLIARMDADDINKLDRCEKLLPEMWNNPDLAVIGGQIEEFSENDSNSLSRIVPCEYKKICKFSKRRSPFNHPTIVFRKDIIQQIGGYSTLGRKEDLDLFIRLINQNYFVGNIPDIVLKYRVDKNNIRRRKSLKNCKEYISVIYKSYRIGHSNLFDLIYVLVTQLIVMILPVSLLAYAYRKIFRKKV